MRPPSRAPSPHPSPGRRVSRPPGVREAVTSILALGVLALGILALGVLALAWTPAPTAAQSGFVAGGAGVGLAWMTVGGRHDAGVAPLLALQAGTARNGARRWLVELAAAPVRRRSPILDEGYRAATALVGRSLGSRLTLTPSLGLQHRWWSGAERVEASDLGIAWGVAAGTRIPLAKGIVAFPELSWQASSIELEGRVGGSMVALRVLVARGLR